MKKMLPTLALLLLTAGAFAQFRAPVAYAAQKIPAAQRDTATLQHMPEVRQRATFSKAHAVEPVVEYSRPRRTILSHAALGGLVGFSVGVSLTNSNDPYNRTQLRDMLAATAFGTAIGVAAGAVTGVVRALKGKKATSYRLQ